MPRLTEYLEDAVGAIEPSFSYADLEGRAQQRRVRRRYVTLVVSACSVVAVVAALVIGLSLRAQRRSVRITTNPGVTHTRPGATGTALVFDDGYDGITTVDVDARTATRRPIEGQRAGDAPYRLGLVDGSLVVGWSDVYAAPVAGGPATHFPNSTIWFPAAEPNTLWVFDDPGGRVPILRRVDVTGRVLQEAQAFDPRVAYPSIGIPGGVAFQTQNGLGLWNATTRQFTGYLGTKGATATAVHGSLLAWCDARCAQIHVTALGGRDLVVSAPKTSSGFNIGTASFSPDGRALAVMTGASAAPKSGAVVMLIDTATGVPRVFNAGFSSEYGTLAWSPTSREVWASASPDGASKTHLARYQVSTGTVQHETLPFSAGRLALVLSRTDAASLVPGPFQSPVDCLPPRIQPSGRTGSCRFTYANTVGH